MKLCCGTDIIEIKRIQEAIEQLGDRFLIRIYTEKERKYCEQKGRQKYQHYAARFAAKEAVFKAISTTLQEKYDISWTDIEILNNEQGRPKARLQKIGKDKIEAIDISLSHCKEYATATAIASIKEGKNDGVI